MKQQNDEEIKKMFKDSFEKLLGKTGLRR